MRFDIKYAYFNFLQSIHYKLPKNSVSHGRQMKLCSNDSKSRKDETDAIVSVETRDAIESAHLA